MTQRKTGVVVDRDTPDAPVDFISIGLKAFGHRAAIRGSPDHRRGGNSDPAYPCLG
jgi:hypothetical protein